MAASALACDAFKNLVRAYERVQVELHGKYSLERLFRLHAYQHTYTFWSCLLVAVATPLPCLAIIILADLIPLNAPSDGLAKSHVFWVRAFVVVLFITLTLLEQSRRFVPSLPCSTWFLLVMSILISLGAVVCTIGLASQVGFPLPFTLISGTPSWFLFYAIFITTKWGQLLRESRLLRQQWLAYIKVVTVQMSLTIVYPAFIFVFIRLDGWEQTAFALLLPLMKLVAKNALSVSFDNRLEDLKPEGVIFNVEVFHALYMSCCMQSSSSIVTTALLMVLDFLHAWSSLNDVSYHLRNIQRLESRLEADAEMSADGTVESANDDLSLIEKAMFYAHYDTSVRTNSAIRSTSGAIQREQLAAVVPMATPSAPVNASNERDVARSCSEPFTGASRFPLIGQRLMASQRTRRRTEPRILFGEMSTRKRKSLETLTDTERVLYVSSLLQVLHIVEFILLIEFVEVIVPVVYCVYLSAMFHLPNRVFYPQLATMNPDSLLATIGNVLAYAALEFVSFVSLCVAVRRKVQLSPMHQLAFVLHSQWVLVQSKMVLWVVFAVQVSLTHFGYDYSFQFTWLKAKP